MAKRWLPGWCSRLSLPLGWAKQTHPWASWCEGRMPRWGLPVEPPPMTVEEWLEPMFRDKKRDGDLVKLILCAGPGCCFGRLTSWDELRAFFEARGAAV